MLIFNFNRLRYNFIMKINKYQYIIGIDEAGRGALSGPVSVAAVALKVSGIRNCLLNVPLRDSKKLSFKQREIWFDFLSKESQLSYSAAMVSPKIIDRINITRAANLAASRALKKLLTNNKQLIKNSLVLLDGGLFVKNFLIIKNGLSVNTIIKGDEQIPAIAMASIIAKVSRDRTMIKLHKNLSQYEFNRHKGYGTKKHIKAIKKFGLSPVHRKTFGNFI